MIWAVTISRLRIEICPRKIVIFTTVNELRSGLGEFILAQGKVQILAIGLQLVAICGLARH